MPTTRIHKPAPSSRTAPAATQAAPGFAPRPATAGPRPDAPPAHDFGSVAVHAPGTAAGGGASAAPIQMWPDWETLKRIGQDSRDAFHSMKGSETGPLPQGPRSDLATHLQQYPNPQPFTRMLGWVNRGMGINTDAPLPADKAQKYIRDSGKVERGEMRGSTAFFNSSRDWAGRGNYPASILNAGGGALSFLNEAMEDAHRRKTGR